MMTGKERIPASCLGNFACLLRILGFSAFPSPKCLHDRAWNLKLTAKGGGEAVRTTSRQSQESLASAPCCAVRRKMKRRQPLGGFRANGSGMRPSAIVRRTTRIPIAQLSASGFLASRQPRKVPTRTTMPSSSSRSWSAAGPLRSSRRRGASRRPGSPGPTRPSPRSSGADRRALPSTVTEICTPSTRTTTKRTSGRFDSVCDRRGLRRCAWFSPILGCSRQWTLRYASPTWTKRGAMASPQAGRRSGSRSASSTPTVSRWSRKRF